MHLVRWCNFPSLKTLNAFTMMATLRSRLLFSISKTENPLVRLRDRFSTAHLQSLPSLWSTCPRRLFYVSSGTSSNEEHLRLQHPRTQHLTVTLHTSQQQQQQQQQQRAPFTTTARTTMADNNNPSQSRADQDYLAFLNKANEELPAKVPQAPTATATGNKKPFRTRQEGVEVPAPLLAVVDKPDAFYVSDADEPFEVVALAWDEAGRGLPDEGSFYFFSSPFFLYVLGCWLLGWGSGR
jgi:hypothetical protein